MRRCRLPGGRGAARLEGGDGADEVEEQLAAGPAERFSESRRERPAAFSCPSWSTSSTRLKKRPLARARITAEATAMQRWVCPGKLLAAAASALNHSIADESRPFEVTLTTPVVTMIERESGPNKEIGPLEPIGACRPITACLTRRSISPEASRAGRSTGQGRERCSYDWRRRGMSAKPSGLAFLGVRQRLWPG